MRTRLGSLSGDERGTVAMIFALCLFALVMLLGLAIDIGRAIHTKTKLASAADAAALAAAKSLHDNKMTTGEIQALARRFFDTNLGGSGQPNFGSISDFQVLVDRDKSTVTISATADVPTTFARIGGVQQVTLPTEAVAAFNPKDIEIALSLDLTGSMCNPCSKIHDLQAAASDMVDILLAKKGTNSNKVRVALAPFAAGVNAGPYATQATNKRSDGCVFERDGAEQATDAAPFAGTYLKVASDKGVAATRNNCPSGAEVTPLSDDSRTLKSAIGDMRSGGSTAGHLGTAWAWYLISPNWQSLWPASSPAPYGDKRTIKAVVLMTDGVYNTFGGSCDRNCSNVSPQARDSQDVARRLCQNMKAQNVRVYSVGFMLDDPIAETVLRNCASDALYFFRAENGNALRDAFRMIADDLLRLRLTQ